MGSMRQFCIITGLMAFISTISVGLLFAQLPPGYVESPGSTAIRLEPGWTVYRGQSGLVVFHPVGWQFSERDTGGFLAYRPSLQGNATALILVQPFKDIRQTAASITQGLGHFFPDLFPGVRTGSVRTVSSTPEVSVARIDYSAAGSLFRGSSMFYRQGAHGALYVMASNSESWHQDAPVMEKMLRRFFYSAPEPWPIPDLPEMEIWRDPLEGAFTCPVPKGWKVEGGMRRFSPTDYRPELSVTSRDDRIQIRIGDAWIPLMKHPGQMMQNTGFHEGSWYSLDGLSRQLVMKYLPATEFLTTFYLPHRTGRISNARSRQLPELSRMEMDLYGTAGISVRADTGEMHFDVQSKHGMRKGYAFIQTLYFPILETTGDGWWMVGRLYGYLADPSMERTAEAVLSHMVGGYRTDPQWQAMQLRTTVNVSEIWQAEQNRINEMIHSRFKERTLSQDRRAEKYTRTIRGEVIIEDPYTKERFEVPAGSNYYWRVEGTRDFIGTHAHGPHQMPDYWVHEMTVIE